MRKFHDFSWSDGERGQTWGILGSGDTEVGRPKRGAGVLWIDPGQRRTQSCRNVARTRRHNPDFPEKGCDPADSKLRVSVPSPWFRLEPRKSSNPADSHVTRSVEISPGVVPDV